MQNKNQNMTRMRNDYVDELLLYSTFLVFIHSFDPAWSNFNTIFDH